MSAKSALGKKVRAIREEKGWSQDQLSDKSGLHRTYISGIERGQRNPTVEIVERIAKTFHVHISVLFEREPEK